MRQLTREFSEGASTYTLWLDWIGDRCRIVKVGRIAGRGGGTLNPQAGYGETTGADLGWAEMEFESAEAAEKFVRDEHRSAGAKKS